MLMALSASGERTSLSLKELAEALKELTYEHVVFSKRFDELANLLDKDAPKAINELVEFFENSGIPHREREETRAFPAILKLKPDEEPLIKELIEEHKRDLEEPYRALKESLTKGAMVDAEDKQGGFLINLRSTLSEKSHYTSLF